jgi:hypothetical protein
MKTRLFLFLTIVFICVYACSDHSENANQKATNTPQTIKDTSSITETIKDPNNPKPMALAMRQMASNAQQMKDLIEKGEKLDKAKFPFIRFYLVEPTDPSVLEPQFYENARLFQETYTALFKHPEQQEKYFNVVINNCVNCHQSYCSGPLKRIKKLYLEN